MDRTALTPMWRDVVPSHSDGAADRTGPCFASAVTPAHVFPSGRRALSEALVRLGLGRANRVAIPEWSSACVCGAVGKVAMPLPAHEALHAGMRVDAVIVYETWGWPVPQLALARLRERLPGVPLILDRVDTPAPGLVFGGVPALHQPVLPDYSVWSLGKVLGAAGGGLLTDAAGALVTYQADDAGTVPPVDPLDPASVYRFREYSAQASSDIRSLAHAGAIEAVIEAEGKARRENLAVIANTQLIASLTPWMFDALADGAAPNLLPIMAGADTAKLQAAREVFAQRCGLDTQIYHFDLAGDPLAPDFQQVLAVPVHGQVRADQLHDALADYRRQARRVVVVGGGVSGLMAARIAASQGHDVTLIEAADAVGGLYRSDQDERGHAYDTGTHVPMTTGHGDCDRLLFADLVEHEWHTIKRSLREGVVENGALYESSGCPSIDAWPPIAREAALCELVDALGTADDAAHLEAELQATFGPQITAHMFGPIMRKLTGLALDQLATGSHRTFSLSRIRVAGAASALALKASPQLDARVAYARTADGRSDITKLYPHQGGAQRWVDVLTQALETRGVAVMTGCQIADIRVEGGRVRGVTLKGGEPLDADLLVWTAPAALLLRAAGVPFKSRPPRFVDLILIHLRVDAPSPHALEYLCDYDPTHALYRATFYPQLVGAGVSAKAGAGVTWLTAEVLDPSGVYGSMLEADEAALVDRVYTELQAVGAVDPQAKREWVRVRKLARALPLIEPGNEGSAGELARQADALAANIVVGGRRDGAHFISALLIDTYERLCNANLADADAVDRL